MSTYTSEADSGYGRNLQLLIPRSVLPNMLSSHIQGRHPHLDASRPTSCTCIIMHRRDDERISMSCLISNSNKLMVTLQQSWEIQSTDYRDHD